MSNLLFIETNTTGTGSMAMKIAKEYGYRVHFWTSDLKQYSRMTHDHPLVIADVIRTIDTYDIDLMKQTIERENLKFEGILAFDDYHLIPVSMLTRTLALPGHDPDALQKVRFKERMRQHVKNHGITAFDQPHFYVIDENMDVQNLPISFPCVLKPVDDSGSNGVTISMDMKQLSESFSREKNRLTNERGYRLQRRWLVEEYIEGQEYSAELLYTRKGWQLVSVTQKETTGQHAVECGHVTGKGILPVPDLEQRCRDLLDSIGLNYGAAHIEFLVKENRPYLVEVNPRLAGDCIPELVQLATGVNMVEHMVMQAVGRVTEIDYSKNRYAAIRFAIPDRKGVYEGVAGLEHVRSIPQVVRHQWSNFPFKVEDVRSSYDRLGFVITAADSRLEALKAAEKAISSLDWKVSAGV